MFGFSRPAQLYVDPWGRGGYVLPEDLYAGRAAPFGFLDRELPCECPSCCPEGLFDTYVRPYARVYQHPSPASHHRRPHQHSFFSLPHPQQAELLRHAHPTAHAFAKPRSAPAAATAAWLPECDVDSVQDAQPEAVLHEATPCAAGLHSGAMPASSHGSLCSSSSSSSTARPHPFTQPPEPVYAPGCRVRPAPFSVAAQQQQQRREQQQQQREQPPAYNHLPCQQQPGSPAASVANGRGRHSIPVFAGSTHQAAPEQVPVQFVTPVPAPKVAAPQPQPQVVLHRPARHMTRAEAATVIQSWWRMRRLARQRPTLQALAAAAAQLRSTSSLFQAYKHDSSAAGSMQQAQQRQHISHKQYLELNELAMRVLLALDATSCGFPELRAVRKRLTASAINLLDDIQASYSAAVNASMELSDDLVRAAVQNIAKPAGPASVGQQQQQQGQPGSLVLSSQVDDPVQQALQHGQQEQVQQHQSLSSDEFAAAAEEEPTADEELQLQQQLTQSDAQHRTEGAAACSGIDYINKEVSVAPEQLAVAQQQQQQQSMLSAQSAMAELNLPVSVRVVLAYPGSSVDAATQTD